MWICGIRMKYVLLLSSPKFTHSCCWISSPCWCWILMYSIMRGVYAGSYDVFVASGATASEIKLVPHISRVGLDTLHVLGRVVFAYEFDVNTCSVYLCAWWLIAIGEPYACAFIDGNNLCQCLFMKDWLLMHVKSCLPFDYDWCETNSQWSVVDRLPICMNG